MFELSNDLPTQSSKVYNARASDRNSGGSADSPLGQEQNGTVDSTARRERPNRLKTTTCHHTSKNTTDYAIQEGNKKDDNR